MTSYTAKGIRRENGLGAFDLGSESLVNRVTQTSTLRITSWEK